MREDVRIQKERLDPGWGTRCDCSAAEIKLRRTDDRRLRCMLTAARGDQGNRTDVLTAIRVGVNARM